jgi:hypothetical protein
LALHWRFSSGQFGKKNEIKDIQIGKEEIRLSPFANDSDLYIDASDRIIDIIDM